VLARWRESADQAVVVGSVNDVQARRRARWTLALVLAVALASRAIAIFAFPGLAHPDENFSFFEPAHRLAFGYGIKDLAFEDGLRSYVIPYLLAALFRIAEPIFGGPQGYIRFARLAIALISLAPVAAIYAMGRRTSLIHGLIAGLVAATWFDIVYFSCRPLTEAIGCDAALVALALAARPRDEIGPKLGAAIGACLALTAMVRLQLIPGVAFVAFWLGRGEARRWLTMAAGGLPIALAFGAVDWITWGAPFRSYLQAVNFNLIEGKASNYGPRPADWYLVAIFANWSLFIPAIAVLIAVRWRKSALWLGFAVVTVLVHSLIPHKNYRYIYPAMAALIVVAAMGSADLLAARARISKLAVAVTMALWITASFVLAFYPPMAGRWAWSRGLILSEAALAKEPGLCGLLFYDQPWYETGGYAFLHRDVPVYVSAFHPEAGRDGTPAFNAVVVRRSSLSAFPTYRRLACYGEGGVDDACTMMRAGPCRRVSGLTPLMQQHRLGERPYQD
jgi:hypothetical protein